MKRPIGILIAGALTAVLAGAAAPSLPEPPVPPAFPPDEEAPVPDASVNPPQQLAEQGARVSLENYRQQQFDKSLGFAPGSRFETSEERKGIQTPGFKVRIPLK